MTTCRPGSPPRHHSPPMPRILNGTTTARPKRKASLCPSAAASIGSFLHLLDAIMKKLPYRDSFSKMGHFINTQLQLGGALLGGRLPLPFPRGEGWGEGSVCSPPLGFGPLR